LKRCTKFDVIRPIQICKLLSPHGPNFRL